MVGGWGGGPAKYIPAVVIVLKAGMCNQSCFLTRAGGGSCCCFPSQWPLLWGGVVTQRSGRSAMYRTGSFKVLNAMMPCAVLYLHSAYLCTAQ